MPHLDRRFSSTGLHPAFLRLGVQYAEGILCGSNARCVGLLAAMKHFVGDYTTPPQKELARDLEARLKPNIT
jgi:translation initiation factor eIF-2B subunit delta